MDTRHSFLSTVDHLPCELIRSLWLLQSLNRQNVDPSDYQMKTLIKNNKYAQIRYMRGLIDEQLQFLNNRKEFLSELKDIKKITDKNLLKQISLHNSSIDNIDDIQQNKKLTIKISLKKNKSKNIQTAIDKKAEYAKNDNTRYCFCNDVSYGDMIACDNDLCKREWFHYGCIPNFNPKAFKNMKWFCSDTCRRQYLNNQKIKKRSGKGKKKKKIH